MGVLPISLAKTLAKAGCDKSRRRGVTLQARGLKQRIASDGDVTDDYVSVDYVTWIHMFKTRYFPYGLYSCVVSV